MRVIVENMSIGSRAVANCGCYVERDQYEIRSNDGMSCYWFKLLRHCAREHSVHREDRCPFSATEHKNGRGYLFPKDSLDVDPLINGLLELDAAY